jgi:two-component system, LuxR family, response regulator FixJ
MGKDVFIIDDDASVRRALERLLTSAGYRVRSFASAHGALGVLLHDRPACLIVDVRMPEYNGLAMLESLLRGGTAVPVIMISGHGDGVLARRALKAGAHAFLMKPFDDEALLASVAHAVTRAES